MGGRQLIKILAPPKIGNDSEKGTAPPGYFGIYFATDKKKCYLAMDGSWYEITLKKV